MDAYYALFYYLLLYRSGTANKMFQNYLFSLIAEIKWLSKIFLLYGCVTIKVNSFSRNRNLSLEVLRF